MADNVTEATVQHCVVSALFLYLLENEPLPT